MKLLQPENLPWCLSSGPHPSLGITEAAAKLISVQRHPGWGTGKMVFKVEYLFFPLLVVINSLSHTVVFTRLDVSL